MSKASSSSDDGSTSSSSSSSSADSGGAKPSAPRRPAEHSNPSRADRDPGHGGARRDRETGPREPAGGRREERPPSRREEGAGRDAQGFRGREGLVSGREEHRRGSDRRAEDDRRDDGRDRYGSRRREDDQDGRPRQRTAGGDDHRGGRGDPRGGPPQHRQRRSPGDEGRRGGRDPRGRSRSTSPRGSSRHRRRSNSPRRSRSPRGGRGRSPAMMPPPPPREQPRPDSRECFNCGKTGHLARDCPSERAEGGRGGGSGRPDTRECYKCHQTGHIAKDCPNARADENEGKDLQWGTAAEREEQEKTDPKDLPEPEPEFGLSGKLAEESNTVKGRVMKFQEPPEARKPTKRWRLYTFKNGDPIDEPMHIHRLPTYLFGRDRKVIDIPTDHPSCSKQHAVLCYRETDKEGKDGMMKTATRPYLMDLGSSNGTFLNGDRIEPERFYELLEQDNIKFGNSSRDYVLLHDDSAGD